MFDLNTSIHILGHVLIVVYAEHFPYWWHSTYDTSLIMPVFMRFHLSWLVPVYVRHFHPLWRSWSIVYLQPLWRSWSFVYLQDGDSDLCILYVVMTTHDICISCLFMAIVLLCIRDYYMYLQLYAKLYYCTMLIGWLVFHLGTFITSLLGWTYNVFRPSYKPSDLIH